jgi:ribonuclease PH
MGLFPRADGSALFEQGNTRVLAVVHGPRQPERAWTAERDAATITCSFRCVDRIFSMVMRADGGINASRSG